MHDDERVMKAGSGGKVTGTGQGHFPGGAAVKIFPSNAGGAGLISGQEAEIPPATKPKNQTVKQRQYCNKFNKDF